MSAPIRADAKLFADIVDYANSTAQSEFHTRSFLRQAKNLVSQSQTSDSFAALGIVLGLADQYQEGLRYFNQAISLAPDNAALAANHGVLLRSVGDPRKALIESNRAWHLCEGNPAYAKESLLSALALGDFPEADSWIQKLNSLNQEAPEDVVEVVEQSLDIINNNNVSIAGIIYMIESATAVMHERGLFSPIETGVCSDDSGSWVSFRTEVNTDAKTCGELETALIDKLLDGDPEQDPGPFASMIFLTDNTKR